MSSWMILSCCSSHHEVLIEVLTQEGPMIDNLNPKVVISRTFVLLISHVYEWKGEIGSLVPQNGLSICARLLPRVAFCL